MVKEVREKQGISQNALSKMSGVKQSVISYIESGRTKNPRIDTLIALAEALGVSVTELTRKAG